MPGARDGAPESAGNGDGQDETSLADKLSRELSNWRRQRHGSGRLSGRGAPEGQSGPARTIKVRGHETLVVSKPKLAPKPPSSPAPENG